MARWSLWISPRVGPLPPRWTAPCIEQSVSEGCEEKWKWRLQLGEHGEICHQRESCSSPCHNIPPPPPPPIRPKQNQFPLSFPRDLNFHCHSQGVVNLEAKALLFTRPLNDLADVEQDGADPRSALGRKKNEERNEKNHRKGERNTHWTRAFTNSKNTIYMASIKIEKSGEILNPELWEKNWRKNSRQLEIFWLLRILNLSEIQIQHTKANHISTQYSCQSINQSIDRSMQR